MKQRFSGFPEMPNQCPSTAAETACARITVLERIEE